MVMNYEARNMIERLRESAEQWINEVDTRKEAAALLEQQSERLAKLEEQLATIYSQPVELPEPVDDVRIHNGHEYLTTEACDDYYTANQLTRAVQEATARALEAAARECDTRYMGDNNREDMEARRCADAIRNLIGNVPLRGVK